MWKYRCELKVRENTEGERRRVIQLGRLTKQTKLVVPIVT